MMSFLESKRLQLRPFHEQDESFIRELDSNPEVMQYLTNGKPSDDKEVKRAMGVFLGWRDRLEGRYGYWIAEEKKSRRAIGWFHLRPLKSKPEDFQNLELGYRLKQEFWEKGYATEMSQVLVKYAFEQMKADSVWAHSMKKNLPSQNVMMKCGLSFEREEVYDAFPGEYKMSVWYRIEKSSFHQLIDS